MAGGEGDIIQVNATPGKKPAPKPRPRRVPELPASDRRNWLIHLHFVRQDYDICGSLAEEQLAESGCWYALYIRGLILRKRGAVQEALETFQRCLQLSAKSIDTLKQVARCLFLLARFQSSLEIYKKADALRSGDWEVIHNIGVSEMHLGQLNEAAASFKRAAKCGRHELSYVMLAKCQVMLQDTKGAIESYKESLQLMPENPTLLASLGQLYLEAQSPQKAFELLGACLQQQPENTGAILAAGSILHGHNDFDVALAKYRQAFTISPESPALWNNSAMCFFAKDKPLAAISCLKRANYLSPFDWKVLYNLGLLHLHTQQYASAFHFFSSSLTQKPKNGQLYAKLAITLAHLDDADNATRAYEAASKLLPNDSTIYLNWAIHLFNKGETAEAVRSFREYQRCVKAEQKPDPVKMKLADKFAATLNIGTSPAAVSSPQRTAPPELVAVPNPSIPMPATPSQSQKPAPIKPSGSTLKPLENSQNPAAMKPSAPSPLDQQPAVSPQKSETKPDPPLLAKQSTRNTLADLTAEENRSAADSATPPLERHSAITPDKSPSPEVLPASDRKSPSKDRGTPSPERGTRSSDTPSPPQRRRDATPSPEMQRRKTPSPDQTDDFFG